MSKNNDCGCDDALPNNMGRTYASAEPGPSLDASRPLFRVGQSAKVSDALAALTFVKGSPVMGSVTGASATALQVQVQRTTAVVAAAPYDLTSPTVQNMATTLGTADTFNLARIGGRVQVPVIDEMVTVPGSVQDFADLQLQAAATGLLRRLDKEIGQGTTVGSPSGFDGLARLASTASPTRTAVSTSLDKDMRMLMTYITPNGSSGTGEGIDCFFGGPLMLRKLMALAVTQGCAGEWKRDFRTGRNVFHYMGIPYYRTETSETSGPTGGRIYGANLGETGLQLIYSYGSASTFGISVQETPVSVSTGTREITVQGAWTLVLWEPESIYELTGIDTTSL